MPISIDALSKFIQLPVGVLSIPGKLTVRNTTGTTYNLECGFVDAVTHAKIPGYSGVTVNSVPGNGSPVQADINYPPPGPAVLPYVSIPGTSPEVIAYAANATLVGSIVLIGNPGQSNEQNFWAFADPNAPAPDPQTLMMTPSSSNAWTTPTGALITGLNLLRRHLGRPVAAIVTAAPGIGCSEASMTAPPFQDYWNDTSGAAFTRSAAMIAAAGGDFDTHLMGPGEADASASVPAPVYCDALMKAHSDTLALLTSGRPASAVRTGVIEIGPMWPAGVDPSRTREGQHQFLRRTPGTFLASWADDLTFVSSIHYDVPSLVKLCERWALAVAFNTMR